MRLLPRIALALVVIVVGCSAPQSYLDVTVKLAAGTVSRCVQVVVSTEAGVEKKTGPMKVTGSPLRVAVYRDELPKTVSVQALGFSDDACTTRTAPTEESPKVAATFGTPPASLTVTVEKGVATDADGDGFSPPSDCNDGDPTVRPGVAEKCADGIDNDCSNGADCADFSCADQVCGAGATCSSLRCQENLCSDGIDGDGDGQTDCADADCATKACGTGLGAICTGTTCVEALCADNTDNDGDGMRDCADSDCASASCGTMGTCTGGICVEPVETNCEDGADNDGDSRIDCGDQDCNGRTCSDGNACTTGETCTGSNCGSGAAVTCLSPANSCYADAGTCSPATGVCSYAAKPTTAACDDGDPCTVADACNGDGGCASSPKVCPAPTNQCLLAGACLASLDGGCAYPVRSGACDDGNACTVGDTCSADAGCASGALVTCTPGDCKVFTPGNCDADGGCRFTNAPVNTVCSTGRCDATGTCVPAPTFSYAPANVNPANFPPLPGSSVVIGCNAVFSSGPTPGFTTGCTGFPSFQVGVADGGSAGELTVLSLTGLTVTDAGSLTLTGTRPIVILVFGDAGIDGPILANSTATGNRSGPGAALAIGCGNRTGQPGRDDGSRGGGGGGAGFLTNGGFGGASNGNLVSGGDAGIATAGGDVPLLVGCFGGGGKSDTGFIPGGVGGGALQLSVSGQLSVTSVISTSGRGGTGGFGGSDPGGGGGGSGGALLLQARQLSISATARLTSNGGAGGGGAQGSTAQAGDDGAIDSASVALGGTQENGGGRGGDGAAGSTPPANGTNASKGGGGGGGSAGRIYVHHVDTGVACSISGSAVISPAPVKTNCP